MNDFLPGDSARTLKSFAKKTASAVSSAFDRNDVGYPPLMTVDHVDLTKYAGKWYELARLPLTFQDDTNLSTAEYSLNDDGSVKVHNTEWKNGEELSSIDGTATPASGAEQSNARLSVRFGGLLKWLPENEEGNYWVLKIDDDYTMALVGTHDRGSLWLLARDPKQAESDQAEAFLDHACKAGYDTSKLLIDDWEKGFAHPVDDGADQSDDGGTDAA